MLLYLISYNSKIGILKSPPLFLAVKERALYGLGDFIFAFCSPAVCSPAVFNHPIQIQMSNKMYHNFSWSVVIHFYRLSFPVASQRQHLSEMATADL
jgi:hypothetical protein